MVHEKITEANSYFCIKLLIYLSTYLIYEFNNLNQKPSLEQNKMTYL